VTVESLPIALLNDPLVGPYEFIHGLNLPKLFTNAPELFETIIH